MDLAIDEAIEELKNTTDKQIEYDTSKKWAARASAAYILSLNEEILFSKLNYFIWGEDLRHEALEHSALYGDAGFLLNELQIEIDKHRQKAIDSLNDTESA
jgi:hypothetical protein